MGFDHQEDSIRSVHGQQPHALMNPDCTAPQPRATISAAEIGQSFTLDVRCDASAAVGRALRAPCGYDWRMPIVLPGCWLIGCSVAELSPHSTVPALRPCSKKCLGWRYKPLQSFTFTFMFGHVPLMALLPCHCTAAFAAV